MFTAGGEGVAAPDFGGTGVGEERSLRVGGAATGAAESVAADAVVVEVDGVGDLCAAGEGFLAAEDGVLDHFVVAAQDGIDAILEEGRGEDLDGRAQLVVTGIGVSMHTGGVGGMVEGDKGEEAAGLCIGELLNQPLVLGAADIVVGGEAAGGGPEAQAGVLGGDGIVAVAGVEDDDGDGPVVDAVEPFLLVHGARAIGGEIKIGAVLGDGLLGVGLAVVVAAQPRVVLMVSESGENGNLAGEVVEGSGVVAPEFVPIALFAGRFHDIAGDDEEVRCAGLDGGGVRGIADGLREQILAVQSVGGVGPFRGRGCGFRFGFGVGVHGEADGCAAGGCGPELIAVGGCALGDPVEVGAAG